MMTSENTHNQEIKIFPLEESWEANFNDDSSWELLIETNDEGVKRHWFKQNYGGLPPQTQPLLYQ